MLLHSKYFSLILTFLFLAIYGYSQVTPSTSTRPVAVPVAQPAPYVNPAVSYVRSWEPQMPTTDPVTATSTSRTTSQVIQSTQYVDSWGRPIQGIIKAISPTGKDFVRPGYYDSYGRKQYDLLPYSAQTGNSSDGKFKLDPVGGQRSYFRNTAFNPGIAADSIFYAQTEFESSPSSAPIKIYQPGSTWAKEGGNKPVTQYTFANVVSDSVRMWIAQAGNTIPLSTTFYAAGQLSKTVYTDQQGVKTIEFQDLSGQTVLRKVQAIASPGTGHVGWLCTYFVYDALGNLNFVIPPQAVRNILGSWSLTNVAPGLCYQYRYDERGRNTIAKLPGADSTETVFDTRNRPVLQRDGNLKAKGQWLLVYYDGLDRAVRVALYQSGVVTRDAVQTQINAAVPGTFPFSASLLTDLAFYYYDDNYAFTGVQAVVSTDLTKPQQGTNPYYETNTGISHRTVSKLTGSRVRVLNGTQFLTTTIYYNDKGRVIQQISDNLNGGKEVATFLYDFSGKLLSTYVRHTNPHSTVTPQTTLLRTFKYDATGNLLEVATQVNDNATPVKTLATYTYNEENQIKTKQIGLIGSNAIETQNYEYNIGGTAKSINKDFINTANSTSNWFGQDLAYDYGYTTNQFRGELAGTRWKSRGDGIARALGFTYDPAGRLLTSDFSQQNQGSSLWTRDKVDFTLNALSYDANGNIQGFQQKGMKGLSIAIIDSLKFGYTANTNKLFFVTDKKNDAQSILGDFHEINNNETQDYTFDNSGNLLTDLNRSLSIKRYNYLNLPDSLAVSGTGYLEFTYDAAGNKLSKKVTTTSPVSVNTYDYLNGFIYKNDSLVFFGTDEGRVRMLYRTGMSPMPVYDYFISDHLGNTRMVLTEETNTATYAATLETANLTIENALFANINATRVAKPAGYPIDGTTSPNDFVARLNASSGSNKIGPAIVLRVMAGDTIQIGAKAFYKSTAASTSSSTPADMLTALLQAFAANPSVPSDGAHGNGTGSGSPLVTSFTSTNYQQLQQKDPAQNQASMPKAYLSYVLFDEQLNMVDANSGVRQVQGSPDQLQTLATSRFVVSKTGFLYVYTSNESIQDVYFDNIIISHNPGPLLEETHYYPFGLSMAGISSRALKNKYAENRFNYNGIEQTTEIGLNQYDALYRTLDPQIGRWWQMDPAATDYAGISPYNSNFNNPLSFADPRGDDPFWTWLQFVFGYGQGTMPGITLDGVTVYGSRLTNSSFDGLIRNFETNGFSRIAVLAAARRPRIDLSNVQIRNFAKEASMPMRKIDLPEVTISANRMIDGFPASQQVSDPYEWSPQAWRNAIGSQQKSFKFVTNYFAPVVVMFSSFGIEGLATSGVSLIGRGAVIHAVEEEGVNVAGVGYRSFRAFKRAEGAAGPGQAWHHIVEQTKGNIVRFGNEAIHNTENLIRLPHGAGSIHSEISGFYSSIQQSVTGSARLTVRQWLSTQSYQAQYQFGIQTLENLGWIFPK
ncbi:hypothetical protein DVR12_00115 [Chitinophaga silvatica]|uniref:DUF6443 domain-containing protein n=1 Tax=Chitinophaga silvatica TaxID=2282649 RepID=A0A3E1YFR5_9BACT|nr:DUF6443 domain-containing protein [Chitinophaga silvatica]RFS26231.1 hypothetical protein DVR12_00115 [Chitinophaga silvatica]